ncbi:bifunctional diaminohydroxyphosphoribosylaminopyrimidine deaminase/5-amino-6-(5-phosphoribosylamino)uracil reductase RibD [Pelagibacterales bacterium SAG-MED47]|nr:bifunctional diaminohydroxyphosphoribosylaminopyrimidine deaminase/5-amino-6-(5-phosphoribosylamino)uracil reductase RibD [Pelagibacterales bacterium SAG-MED47]
MSSKKDKFTSKDKDFMKLALNLASVRKGLTGENPSVGCLIVKNDRIISIGQTGFDGRPHAEFNAINNSLEKLKGSKMYVTLEPCNHYGKTPPCTNSIIKSGINEIIYGMDDIDKKVKGKSFKILSNRKIKVKKGLLKTEAKNLYDSYIINRTKKLPYVTGKIAISKNRLIYSKGTKRITHKSSDKLTHYLRYKNDSIMISSKTLNIDNPKLNCRLKGLEKFSPKRIILDRNLEIKINSYIFKSTKKNNTIIFHNSSNKKKLQILKRKGISLLKSKVDSKKLFDLKVILKRLYTLGTRNLLIEGGDVITKNLIKNKLIDKFYLFTSPKKILTSKKHRIFTSYSMLNSKYKNKSKISSKVAKDNITIYKR